MAAPKYGLNPHLAKACPEPPVPLAKAWAASYPGSSSPFASSSSSSSASPPSQPLLNLAQGVPGHAPHASLIERMSQEAKRAPMETHGYGHVFGDASLRQALSHDLSTVYGAEVSVDKVACTAGCNMAAAVVFHALAQPGEAIVLPTPWYFNHQMTLASLAVEAVPLPTQSPAFLPSAQAFEDLVRRHNYGPASSSLPRIKAVVLVTPNNPTGSIYPHQLLDDFYAICAREGVALIVDET
ncbi:PLP-dependent transferase [Acaromyces ingoldii]|uniref:PLP-dependent transferase n=1 Tax=Acaromyces ingoldii TaxID=215250 RepID=A0A316YRM3_9BASI|nr:PLP-dependent transferase [Acaromyces ingoldii]PWN91949.1 PLP-dependent transferase [Acaromyces ingoldii]